MTNWARRSGTATFARALRAVLGTNLPDQDGILSIVTLRDLRDRAMHPRSGCQVPSAPRAQAERREIEAVLARRLAGDEVLVHRARPLPVRREVRGLDEERVPVQVAVRDGEVRLEEADHVGPELEPPRVALVRAVPLGRLRGLDEAVLREDPLDDRLELLGRREDQALEGALLRVFAGHRDLHIARPVSSAMSDFLRPQRSGVSPANVVRDSREDGVLQNQVAREERGSPSCSRAPPLPGFPSSRRGRGYGREERCDFGARSREFVPQSWRPLGLEGAPPPRNGSVIRRRPSVMARSRPTT